MAFNHNSIIEPGEPSWGSVEKGKLPKQSFANHDASAKSSWTYPHHWIKGGTVTDDNGIWQDGSMYLHKGGLDAAWSAAQGSRSGQKASQAIIDHLCAHRKDTGMDKMNALVDDALLRKMAFKGLSKVANRGRP